MKREVTGSCHCGAVRFACDVDLSAPTFRCNCTICSKTRYWLMPVPAADFRLRQGEAALREYRFGEGNIVHRFCDTCGIKVFGQASHPAFGGRFFGVSVACLDLLPEVLARLPVTFSDGLHDRPGEPPTVSSYL